MLLHPQNKLLDRDEKMNEYEDLKSEIKWTILKFKFSFERAEVSSLTTVSDGKEVSNKMPYTAR